MSVFKNIFSNPNAKYLNKLQSKIEAINELEKEFQKFSDEQLKEKTNGFKQRLGKGETLDDILTEAFALVRETAKRNLEQRHFDVQMIGGIVLHQGKIAEMKTGEGKTLAATLPVYLNALTGKGVHIITVNDYLTKRDTVWMGQIYNALGLSISCIEHDAAYLYDSEYQEQKDEERDLVGGFKVVESYLRPCSRKEAYAADITYGTNNEFGFDYLRDNMVYDLEQQTQRGFHFAIIDEIDSVLIDEARTPLIISAPDMEASKWYQDFARLIPRLDIKSDYEIDEKMRVATLTEKGIDKIEKILGLKNIYEEKGSKYLHHLEQALRAESLFKKDKDYVVKGGQVVIVDEFTGRLMPGRRWSSGLHQAIEAKERVSIRPESMTMATITFQNYFRLYEKLAGMTGTAITSAEEFDKVYELETIAVPTNKPMIRKALPDRIYKTEEAKFKALVEEIKQRQGKGQPVLVGTRAIEKNEYLGKLLEVEGVPHQILNAKRHEKEGEIIAQAGKLGAVTIATNMAGRGVDIVLGGNPASPEQAKKVKDLAGLHVIGTERHEARRIDNQLRGRSGRQGDPGSSQFFISLEDDLMRIFGGDKIKAIMERLKLPDDQPIEAGLISRAVESAQSKIEGMNFDLRKHVLDYDDVMNKHREVIYKKRKDFLVLGSPILEIIKKQGYSDKDYEKKEKEVGKENMRQIEKAVALKVIDTLWVNHLYNMEHLRDSVRLRAYGQKDPLVEYKTEGHKIFQQLISTIELTIAQTVMKAKLAPKPMPLKQVQPGQKHGRNQPCPCGKTNPETGKPMKYKKCCYPKS